MSEILYNNISKVSKVYKDTLNVSFPVFEQISKYVSQRHDLVHINGKNRKGSKLNINKDVIKKLVVDTENFVNKIDNKLKDQETIRQSKKSMKTSYLSHSSISRNDER